MYFLIEDNDLLQKYQTIWDKVNTDIKQEFASGLAYNKKVLLTKIKSHDNEVADFYYKEIPKVDSNHTCLAVMSLKSAVKKDENYYPQAFLKESKYIFKKVVTHIIEDLESFSGDSDEE